MNINRKLVYDVDYKEKLCKKFKAISGCENCPMKLYPLNCVLNLNREFIDSLLNKLSMQFYGLDSVDELETLDFYEKKYQKYLDKLNTENKKYNLPDRKSTYKDIYEFIDDYCKVQSINKDCKEKKLAEIKKLESEKNSTNEKEINDKIKCLKSDIKTNSHIIDFLFENKTIYFAKEEALDIAKQFYKNDFNKLSLIEKQKKIALIRRGYFQMNDELPVAFEVSKYNKF